MSDDFQKYLDEQLRDSAFSAEYRGYETEFGIIRALIKARNEAGITQAELSRLTGISQGDISKIENGTANPSVKTLKRLAKGLDADLKIEFVRHEKSI